MKIKLESNQQGRTGLVGMWVGGWVREWNMEGYGLQILVERDKVLCVCVYVCVCMYVYMYVCVCVLFFFPLDQSS